MEANIIRTITSAGVMLSCSTHSRVTDLRNKTVEQWKSLRDMGLNEISLGVESGDDWTLERINKGYHASDILEQCHKLDEAREYAGLPARE